MRSKKSWKAAASFCTSNETAQKYFSESVTQLFTAVPKLGGIINIIFGEDNGACVGRKMHTGTCACPRCNERDCGEIFRETALTMTRAMHAINPEAEYLAWFYALDTRAYWRNAESDRQPTEEYSMLN